jgi:hypothetical protein
MPERKSDTPPGPVAALGIPFAHNRVNNTTMPPQTGSRRLVMRSGKSRVTVPLLVLNALHANIVLLFCRSYLKSEVMRKWLARGMASLSVLAILPLANAAVQAAPATTAQETALLARAYAIDLRCRVLSSADGDDLARYLLNSQALLARQTSLKEAQAAVTEGKAAAAGSLCTLDDKSLVVSALAEVRRAGTASAEQARPQTPYNAREPMELARKDPRTTEAPVTKPAPPRTPKIESAPQADGATTVRPKKIKQAKAKKSAPPKKKKIVERVPSTSKAASPSRKPRNSDSLRQYGGLAESYYVALKCRSISYEDAMQLYSRILKHHRAAVAAYPQFEVKAILRAAKAKADIAHCE